MALPTPPAPRIPYDIDGSVVVISRTSTNDHNPFVADQESKSSLNTNLSVGLGITNGYWDIPVPPVEYYAKNFVAVMFPHLMDIKGWFCSAWSRSAYTPIIVTYSHESPNYVEFQVSNDTTNGQDGTWTTVAYKDEYDYAIPWRQANPNVAPITTSPYWLGNTGTYAEHVTIGNAMFEGNGPDGSGWSEISGADGVRAVRLFFPRRSLRTDEALNEAAGFFAWMVLVLHLYGEPSASSDDRLSIMNSAGTDVANLAYGDIDHLDSVVRTVKVKNLSDNDADDVRLTVSPHEVPHYFPRTHYAVRLSLDGETWLPSVRLGDIPSGGLSQGVFVRVDPVPGMVGLRFARLHAFAGGWS